MSFRPTITFGICLAAGVAAGIGLARPSGSGTTQPGATGASVAEQQPVADAGAYGSVPTDAGSQAAQATITIADFSFSDAVMAAPGATVQVANLDSAAHTATADDGAFDTGSIAGGDAGTIVAPAEPGTYTYFCAIHPSMQGTLSVAG